MKITITRHSKTLWNKEKRLQGCKDSPLSPEGMDNILALKEHIKNNHYDAIYSSPIKRAYDTAKLLFDEQPIITDERIREMNFGILEGQKINDIPEEYKKTYHLLALLWPASEKVIAAQLRCYVLACLASVWPVLYLVCTP